MTAKARFATAIVALSLLLDATLLLTSPDTKIYVGPPPAPDLRMGGYTPEDVRALMIFWGSRGRAMYLDGVRTIDLVIPALSMAVFFTPLWALADGLMVRGRRWGGHIALAIAAIGLIPGLFDYTENFLIARAVQAGPYAFDPASIRLASVVTQLKGWTTAPVLALIAGLGVARFRQRKAGSAERGSVNEG